MPRVKPKLEHLCTDAVSTKVTSDLIITGDVDGLIGRGSKHIGFANGGQLLGAHQAEERPFG